ncbi:MAG TPA: SRPBCC family protein [Burkholderiaceae bacterium]|nr:SRPBCC family protein [Burkholderiaceae bacterium]
MKASRVSPANPQAARDENGGTSWLLGFALGAGLMYMLDPDRGRRRRALLRDRVQHTAHLIGDAARVAARDTGHRAQGLWARARGRVLPESATDEVIALRVRAAIGRVVSNVRSIDVDVTGGRVTLRGPVLAHEVPELLARVATVRGVRDIDNRLTTYERSGNVPELQGGAQQRYEPMRDEWPPAARMLTSIIGGTLVAQGLGRRSPFGVMLTTAGAALLVRTFTNRPLGALMGVEGRRRPIFVRKSIVVDAPVDRVFAFWSQPENFPKFMTNVREVTPLGGNRSRWVVAGPAGTEVEWTSEITEMASNELISWRSEPGSKVRQWGTIRFTRANGENKTRLDIMLAYSPPAGDLGHAIAKLFGADPQSEMETDLSRMKAMLETGKPASDAAQPDRPTAPPLPTGVESSTLGEPSRPGVPPTDLPRSIP